MILKLTGHRSFNRPVPGVVNARRHFIRQQPPVHLKKFDRQHANVLQRFASAPGGILRRALDRRIQSWSRRQRKPQDSSTMMILDQRVDGGVASSSTNREHAQLTLKWNKTLENKRHIARCLGKGHLTLHA